MPIINSIIGPFLSFSFNFCRISFKGSFFLSFSAQLSGQWARHACIGEYDAALFVLPVPSWARFFYPFAILCIDPTGPSDKRA